MDSLDENAKGVRPILYSSRSASKAGTSLRCSIRPADMTVCAGVGNAHAPSLQWKTSLLISRQPAQAGSVHKARWSVVHRVLKKFQDRTLGRSPQGIAGRPLRQDGARRRIWSQQYRTCSMSWMASPTWITSSTRKYSPTADWEDPVE